MNKRSLLGTTAIRSFAAATLAFAAPVYAQETQADEQQNPPESLTSEQEAESGQNAQDTTAEQGSSSEIVVTGSRIRRPNLESPLPVTSVGAEEFFETGSVSVGDVLNELPALRSTFSQANSTRFLGTAGLNLLDLRGLGILRTLVLVNGKRHVGGDVLLTGVAVDVNTIPTDLIERVDVVTGGNSAVYGSDAIAGVVNFILKQDYEGFQVRGQGGISKYGDAGNFFISGLAGRNFADGRGNVAVNVEYARQNQAFGAERDWFRRTLTTNDSDPPLTPNGSDGNPDRILNPDFRSVTFGNTGVIRFNTGECGVDPQGTPYVCPFIMSPNGELVPMTGTRVGLGPNGQFVGGNGEGFFSGNQIQIYPQLDRYNINLIGHFDVSDAFVPFIEAKYSRTDSFGSGTSGPAFIAGASFIMNDQFAFCNFFPQCTATNFYNRETISINNPFLTDQARNTIIEQRTLAGLTTTDATRLNFQTNLSALGNRSEEARRNTFRIVGGVRGDISENWNYEISSSYGRLKEKTKVLGNLDRQRFLLAVDAVRDPNTGEIVCRSTIDPTAAFGSDIWAYGVDPNGDARLAADVAACVPFNPLTGQATQAQRDYLLLDTVTNGRVSQWDTVAYISGDTSGLFELPGGPIGLVLGAEYREDNLSYKLDEQVSLGYTFYNAIPAFEAPKSKVKEAFGEIRIPILKNTTFAETLELSGAARVSDYSIGNTGTVWAYNGNLEWAPVRDLRFRGNYARAVRAPNQVELFTPFGANFSLLTDPCDVNAIGSGSQFRAANCAAAGVPVGQSIVYSSSLPFLSGGNENLEAEKSDSITVGGVFTPRFLPGMSLSADYYDIKVKNVITSVTAQEILNSCYDLPTLQNPFCALFVRAGPEGGHGGVPFGIVANSLHSSPVNFSKLRTRGIDMELAYRQRIGNIGRLDTRLNYTHVFELTQFIDPTNPQIGDRLLSETGDPQDAFNWNSSLQTGRFTFGYQMRYIGKQIITDERDGSGEFEDFFPFEGRPPQDADFADRTWYKSRFYHDIRLGVDVTNRYNFYLGIDNVTNVKPPYNASGLTGGSSIYDVRGRFFYGGFVAKF